MVVIVASSRNRNHRCHQQRRTCHQQAPRLAATSPRKHVQLGKQIQRKVAQGGKRNCKVMISKVSTKPPNNPRPHDPQLTGRVTAGETLPPIPNVPVVPRADHVLTEVPIGKAPPQIVGPGSSDGGLDRVRHDAVQGVRKRYSQHGALELAEVTAVVVKGKEDRSHQAEHGRIQGGEWDVALGARVPVQPHFLRVDFAHERVLELEEAAEES